MPATRNKWAIAIDESEVCVDEQEHHELKIYIYIYHSVPSVVLRGKRVTNRTKDCLCEENRRPMNIFKRCFVLCPGHLIADAKNASFFFYFES